MFEEKYKKAIEFMYRWISDDHTRKKPIIPHALRVGKYLYENNYSDDVINAGLLHDILEWSDCPGEDVVRKFGQHVFDIVSANTKDRSIDDPTKRRKEYIMRCVGVGEDALIVKAADVLDSYAYYIAVKDTDEVKRSVDKAKLILNYRLDTMRDPIFIKLESVIS